MKRLLTISPEIITTANQTKFVFDLSYSYKNTRLQLWYDFGDQEVETEPKSFDSVLQAILFHAMQEHCDIRLKGPATLGCLMNLDEMQRAWCTWRPNEYRMSMIEPETVIPRFSAANDKAISAFSGGVDATFTFVSHIKGDWIRRRNLQACLFIHGLDIETRATKAFSTVLNNAQKLHNQHGVKTFWVRTNSKELEIQSWPFSHGGQISACLQWFSGTYSEALLGSAEPYNTLVIPWGSSPLTDYLYSTDAMAIIHDGAAYARTEKIAYLSRYPEMLDDLRVCWYSSEMDRNCGECEKCMRTKLNFCALGVDIPKCFDTPLDLKVLRELQISNEVQFGELSSIARIAEKNGIDAEWLHVLKKRLKHGTGKVNVGFRGAIRVSLQKTGLLESARKVRKMIRSSR